ncbi:MAG: hypothetical protein AB1440_21955 [Pseudomonadota bacterium]|jgi:hypothetical protein
MTTSRRQSPASVAIAAAIVLLVQAFLSGAWMGAQATAGPLDAFGNVLCTAHAGGPSQNGPHNSGYDCDCCLSGCDIAAGIIPDMGAIEPVSTGFVLNPAGKRLVDTLVRRHELQPLSSRGPPA